MLVSPIMFRNPALMVKMATTLDHVTNGKSIFGLGAGWHVNEHQAYGFGFPSPGERVSRLEERSRSPTRCGRRAAGELRRARYYQLDQAYCNPAPLQQPHPPIMVAGADRGLSGWSPATPTCTTAGHRSPPSASATNASRTPAARSGARTSRSLARSPSTCCGRPTPPTAPRASTSYRPPPDRDPEAPQSPPPGRRRPGNDRPGRRLRRDRRPASHPARPLALRPGRPGARSPEVMPASAGAVAPLATIGAHDHRHPRPLHDLSTGRGGLPRCPDRADGRADQGQDERHR